MTTSPTIFKVEEVTRSQRVRKTEDGEFVDWVESNHTQLDVVVGFADLQDYICETGLREDDWRFPCQDSYALQEDTLVIYRFEDTYYE